MITEEYYSRLEALRPEIENIKAALNLPAAERELTEIHEKTAAPDFWNDAAAGRTILTRQSQLKNKIESARKLDTAYDDCATLLEMADEAGDDSLADEIEQEFKALEETVARRRLDTLLTGEYDHNNAILTFHAGAGGTEAQDWAEMLYRMYRMYAEKNGFKVKVLDYLDGDEAGIKSASILIEGENAYGYLKSENGVHRLVRVSPFDASGRRHTSFASLEVMPEIGDDIDIEIRDEDLKIDTYRSGDAGGQHVNKTESAIRITHIPTGIVVACQNERSQYQNKDVAMKMLRSKLIRIKEQEHLDKIEDIKGVQKEIAWGSQIRSYVFMPYTLVKDHRTGYEQGNVQAVMDGDIGGFIDAYLVMKSREGTEA